MQGIFLPSGARLTGHVHRLTPSDESGAQKDGTNRYGSHCKDLRRGLPARTVRQAGRDPHIDLCKPQASGRTAYEVDTRQTRFPAP